MTMLRFYIAGFIMLLLVLFVLLAAKFIKAKPQQFFAFGSLLSVLVFLIVANIMNPDAYIVKSNLERYSRIGKIDASYVRELSADAEPGKIELYKKLGGEDKEVLRGLLQKEKDKLQKTSANWQSGNLSRTRALGLLNELEE
jgi:energy-coupling factor transporter transmembrane protein EcfT